MAHQFKELADGPLTDLLYLAANAHRGRDRRVGKRSLTRNEGLLVKAGYAETIGEGDDRTLVLRSEGWQWLSDKVARDGVRESALVGAPPWAEAIWALDWWEGRT